MRERRFGGDVRVGSPPRGTFHGGRGYSPHRRSRDRDRRTGSPTRGDYSRPRHEIREIRSHFIPGSSSMSSDMETSRRVFGRENPGDLLQRRDRVGHLDGDGDRQLRRLSEFNEGLSHRDSPSNKFDWKHFLKETKRSDGYGNQTSLHFPDYGGSKSSRRVTTEKSYYPGTGFADMGRSGMMVDKPISMEIERDRTFPAYHLKSGTRTSLVDVDGGGRKMNISHKDESMRFEDYLPADKLSAGKLSARELYNTRGEEYPKSYSREESLRSYSRDSSNFVIPLSQSMASTSVPFGSSVDNCHQSRGDGFPVHSDGFGRSLGILTEPIVRDSYNPDSHFKFSRESNLNLEDMRNYRAVQHCPNEGTQRGYDYPVGRTVEKSKIGSVSDKVYRKMASVDDDYGYRESSGPRLVEPIMDRTAATESSHRGHLLEGTLWDHHPPSPEQPISNYPDAEGSSYRNDGNLLDSRNMHLEYEREIYQGRVNTYFREDHGYGTDEDLQSDVERLDRLLMPEYDVCIDGVDNTHQEGCIGDALDLLEHSKKMLRWKFGNKKASRHNPVSKFSSNRKLSAKVHITKSNKSIMNASILKNVGRTSTGLFCHRTSKPNASGRLSARNPLRLKSNVKDIKKRLGPVPVPVPQRVDIPYPWLKNYKPHKSLKKNQDCSHGGIHAEEGGGPLEDNLPPVKSEPPPVKSEPPENSEEFKQVVHTAFFKFVRQLNEKPGQCRRLKEQGKAGSLKCSVCSSGSKEFLDTESLALHSFMDRRIGCRAQHVGYHKAICCLMGWKSAEILDHQWVCQGLPDAEIMAQKEDLIIWPPVVVIHNGSIGNINPDERVVVSVEVLESVLRDMGFGQKSKVCRGKPADQSVMVVRFSSTLSGLQEAERLHKFYADSQHGRTEFKQINHKNGQICDGGMQKAAATKVENVLYGYLGNAEDMDKLDFETKKWFSVRSKKEIQDIADALLTTG